jgi:hypothetical protein
MAMPRTKRREDQVQLNWPAHRSQIAWAWLNPIGKLTQALRSLQTADVRNNALHQVSASKRDKKIFENLFLSEQYIKEPLELVCAVPSVRYLY